jgi:hypothetical protein
MTAQGLSALLDGGPVQEGVGPPQAERCYGYYRQTDYQFDSSHPGCKVLILL